MHNAALRYFLAVANTGSLSEASEKLHVSISAISRQITKLEEEVGCPLFERQARGMVPNKAGELLAAHVRRTLLEGQQVIEEIKALNSFDRSTIRVSTSEAFARDVLPRAITQFLENSPGTRFEVVVTAPGEVTAHVRSGEADIGLTFGVVREPEINVEYTQSAPICAVMPRSHALAGRATISMAELRNYPIALLDRGTTIRQLFDTTASLENLLFEPVLTCNNSSTLYAFTQMSGVVSLTSRLTVQTRLTTDGLVAIPIDHPGMSLRAIQIQTLTGRVLSTVLIDFVGELVKQLHTAD
ncbi:LysR family transcriptional regulator [Burkholderia sp. AU39826]|uniref:LysR family transcriptional regulator n=1 Tax=Burkholderia sp. AU39826 TaxID=2879634 RepID=UPI001CF0EBA5|nr:LysR family transcriptional regulator [Burkholderia sp. AU39826]MCA7972957.1 LysR family transcriptional regulator [Burkholderia sp. AU39826]